MSATHELKCWPEYFERVISGDKPFEIRRDDRDYQTGDLLRLREWIPDTEKYTLREALVRVGYIVRGPRFGIEAGYCVMAIGAP